MSAEAGPQAHSPTQAELEHEYNAKALRPSFLLLSKPEYITTKREDFRYALRRTLPRFFEMLRGLQYNGFPVQRPPLVIVGGVAVSFVSTLPLNTPDLDIELNGFDLGVAGSQANAAIDVRKPNNNSQDFVVLFNRYVYSLMDQLTGMIEQTPEAFDHYDEVGEKEINYDPEVRGGLVSARKAGPFWICLLHPPRYFPKIVILAKIGETLVGGIPNVERVMEIKLPAKIFKPRDPAEFLVEREGLVFASPAKMMPDLVKSLGDKCVALTKLSKKYDGPDGIFVKSLAHDGYWDVVEEPRDREAILTYKVRIITLRNRIAALGGNPNLDVCADYAGMEVLPYVPTAELRDKSLRKARKAAAAAAEKEALVAAEREKVEEIKRQKEQQRLAVAAAKAAEEAEAKRIADAKAAKALAKAKAKQGGRVSPDSGLVAAAGGGAEGESVSVAAGVAAAGGGSVENVAVIAAAPQILKPNSFICFMEGISTSNSDTLDNLATTLNYNYPQESGFPEILCLEVVTPVGRSMELGERKPLKLGFNYAQDGKMLNGVEELVCRTIPQIFDFYKISEENLNKRFRQTVEFLTWISWDINDKYLRDLYQRQLIEWQKRTNRKELTQVEMKDTYANLFQWIHRLLDILFLQVNKLQGNYTFPRPYQHNELFVPFENIVKEIRSSKIDFPFKLSDANTMVLLRLAQTLFATAKGRLILVRLEEEYTKYVNKVAARGFKLNDMPPPVIFFPYPRLLTSEIISVVWSCLVNSEILFLPKMYTLTFLFIEIDKSDELVSEEVRNLSQAILMPFNAGEDLRSINFEMILEITKSLWFINGDDDAATIALKKKAKNIIAIVLLTILEKYDDFLSFNSLEFWQKIIQVDVSDMDTLTLQINEEIDNIRQKEINRITLFNATIHKVLVEKHIEEVMKKDAEKEAAVLAAKERVVAEKVAANAAEKEKQKQIRIQSLADLLGISIADAAKEIENENAGEGGGGGGSRKAGKGKGGKVGKRTRKSRRI